MAAGTFREWLGSELERQQIKRRALARRLAAKHPEGATPATIETYRRAIYKYLDPTDPTIPTESTRLAFAEALGVKPEEIPEDDDEDEPLAREASEILAALSSDQLLEVLSGLVKSKRRRRTV